VKDAEWYDCTHGRDENEGEGLRELAEIVHDVDCKDAKFRRDDAAGVARTIDGIAKLCDRDEDRVERGRALFDELYAAFSGGVARA